MASAKQIRYLMAQRAKNTKGPAVLAAAGHELSRPKPKKDPRKLNASKAIVDPSKPLRSSKR